MRNKVMVTVDFEVGYVSFPDDDHDAIARAMAEEMIDAHVAVAGDVTGWTYDYKKVN